jgi:serine/threonine protein kinase/WD40 repeat protein
MTLHGPDSPAPAARNHRSGNHASAYARLWQLDVPHLEQFLQQCAGMTTRELAAVVRIDLRERWRRGEQPDAREYLDRFSALAAELETAVDIVYAEFLVREQLGQRPPLSEFEQRFPELAPILADQIRLHEAFAQEPEEGGPEDPANAQPPGERPSHPGSSLEADYEIIGELGRGGMAVVYKARQPALNRFVALKMVRRADLDNGELLARFRAEAEVVASLHHPHIVQIYDYGQHEGAPYLALELVSGGALSSRLDGAPWDPRRAAALLEQVARAVHFAHERGVVHRDLKPNNLLISGDEKQFELKIADFGLAKMFRDQPLARTQTGALLGTPSYMAPEQAYGRTQAVGPAADVYALGAILYELLSGRPPYRGETAIETLQQLLLGEPASIHRLKPGLPRDLATICSKCLERDPQRRYASAFDLAEDLRRFLTDRPIQARPIGPWEQSWRWCRRNPALAAALGSVAALLIVVTAVSTWYSGRLSRQLATTQRAELAERKANEESRLRLWDAYVAEIAARNSSRQLGQRFAALQTIERARHLLPELGTTASRELQLRNAAITSMTLPDLRRVKTIWEGKTIYNGAVALAADRFAVTLEGRTLVVGRISDGARLGQADFDFAHAYTCLTPDGRLVAVFADNGCCVWRVTDAGLETAWQSSDVRWLAFLPDGKHVAVVRNGGRLSIDDASSGETIRTLVESEVASPCGFHAPTRRLAVCTPKQLLVVSWETGEVSVRLPVKDPVPAQLAWHPDGECLAVWGDNAITLWNLRTRQPMASLPHPGFAQQMHFSSDGARLVSCTLWDSRLMLWDVGTGQKELEVQAFANLGMDVDQDGRLALLKLDGSSVELWELASGAECRSLPRAWYPSAGPHSFATISPDSRLLLLSGERGLELWDLQRCKRLATQDNARCMAQFDRQGNLLVASNSGIHRWPRHDRLRPAGAATVTTNVISFGPPAKVSSIGVPDSLAVLKGNDLLLYQDVGGWYANSLTKPGPRTHFQPPGDPRKAALSADDRLAAILSWDAGGATVWDTASGSRLADLPIGRFGIADFSPDVRWLATTPGGVQIWRTENWKLAHELKAFGTTPNGLGISFSPDSRALAIGQPNGELRLVDPQSGSDWVRITHPGFLSAPVIAFAPDMRSMVTSPTDVHSPARIWDLKEIRRELSELGLDWPADVLRPATSSAEHVPLEIEWNDGGLQLLNSAVQSVRDLLPAKSEPANE